MSKNLVVVIDTGSAVRRDSFAALSRTNGFAVSVLYAIEDPQREKPPEYSFIIDSESRVQKEQIANVVLLLHAGDSDLESHWKSFLTGFNKHVVINEIWYSGEGSGPISHESRICNRAAFAYKIWDSQPRSGITCNQRDFGELLNWATSDRQRSNSDGDLPRLLLAPPDAGLLTTISVVIQTELFRRQGELDELMKSLSTECPLKQFVNLLIEIDSESVDAPNWSTIMREMGTGTQKCLEEVREVARSLMLPDSWIGNFEQVLTSIHREVEAGQLPSTEALCNLYTSLCELEKGAAEE
jgi:hypothetical protein